MPVSSSEEYKELEEKLGYTFRDKKLLEQALTHKSYAVEKGVKSYETLEFLGDALINLFVVDILLQEFPQAKEGQLAPMKAFFVSEEFLHQLAQELELEKYLLLGGKKGKFKVNVSILGDAFESLWGAIYIDTGRDTNFTRSLFERLYKNRIITMARSSDYKKDYKTILQEITQKRWKERPTYRVVSVSGPQHGKVFEVECSVRNIRAVAAGSNKKEAEQLSAKRVLELLQEL
ncbi:ribonuclease III [Hydrogenobacter thermophilus TK-6]|uniref:Ribonuclease 3 n=1 Tax=Hydrogenobacter thermophilus (strain DSM 6534 / IAM 12695 / TK-6) TaxID=608538 RepID=D3DFW2_HYDTT|nr:ribonuclease III [Hydrogenobacter thermophilus]ADO44651.1 ribonuclease III [Hydrogenobacter thermophilus TK-6]BAI68714.1 ribonuclease III [Hydrogenobacter thermophilus TK-6]